ncbi:MAG: tRNA lysidine(34) synthetase TilS [Candidatus Zixiibacteriota bacterium]|nr:MAG: tRNA lysidine(34) synthetase TilS [candidate division Zixibacteria bacterium]
MIDKFKQTIKDYNLIAPRDAVLVGLSGGPDSVALIHLLHQLSSELKLLLGAVYINHGIRVEAAKIEEEFCQTLCDRLSIDLMIVREDIPDLAHRGKKGIEETARDFRYGVFDRVASEDGYDKIAVGHHADDQVETILFRILRGTGRPGLLGMPMRRDKIVRPLLNIHRREILQYLEEHTLEYCIDQTNQDLDIRRNFIRNQLLQSIRKHINPGVDSALLNLSDIMWHEEQYLEPIVDRAMKKSVSYSPGGKIELALESVCSYDKWLRRRLLRRCLAAISGTEINPNKAVVERLDTACLRKYKAISLSGKIQAVRVENKMVLFRRESSVEVCQLEAGKKVSLKGLCLNFSYRTSKLRQSDLKWIRQSRSVVLDADKVEPPLVVQRFQAGDRFRPLGMTGSKTVNGYLSDRKLHKVYRDEVPVVCDRRGIVWLVGFEIADRVKIDERTGKVIKLECTKKRTDQSSTV